MDKQDALKRINTFQDNTMTEQIGIEITDFGDDFICGRMPVDHRTVQPFGLLHGGASATLAETLGSTNNAEIRSTPTICIEMITVTPAMAIRR